MPLISVIVPVYKVEGYLPKCVDSILNQTFKDIELILVDDGSPDNCGKLCDEFAKKDKRVRVIHKKNGGLSSARNAGIEKAKAEYLTFLDSDDFMDLDALEIEYNIAKERKSDIVELSYRNIFADKIEEETACTGEIIDGTNVDAIEGILDWKHFKPVAWNKLYHKNVIGKIRYTEGKLHEDEYTTYKFFYAAKKVTFVDISKYNYVRSREGSITVGFKENNLDAVYAMRERRDFIIAHPTLKKIEEKGNNIYVLTMLHQLRACYQGNISGPKVTQVLKFAKEDQIYYKTHPINNFYKKWMQYLNENGLKKFGEKCDKENAQI